MRHRFITAAFIIAVVSLAHAQLPVLPFRGTPRRLGVNVQAIGAWFNSCGRQADTPLDNADEIGGSAKLVSSPTSSLDVLAKASGYCAPESTDQGQSYVYQATSREVNGPGLNWDVEVKIAQIPVTPVEAPFFLIWSLSDASNFSYAAIYPPSVNPDVYFGKIVAGVNTDLASANVDVKSDSLILLEVRGTAATLYDDGAEILTATDDTFNDGANSSESWAIGWGAIREPTDYAHEFVAIDWFKFSKVNISKPVDSPPTVEITSPVSPFSTAEATVTLSGTVAAGTSAIKSVTVTCTGENAVTDQAADVSSGSWSYVLTLTNLGASSCFATATDAAGLIDVSGSVTVTKVTEADTDDPTATWVSPSSTPFASSTASITVSLQAADNVAVTSATWANAATSGSGTCQFVSGPSTTVSCGPFVLAGAGVNNVVTVTIADAAGHDALFTRTITHIADLVISTTTLGTLTQNVAVSGKCLVAGGGVPPYTWSVSAGSLPGGVSLNASTGCLLGTPGSVETVTPTFLVTDSQGSPDTASKQISIAVQAAGEETSHTYYETLKARSDRVLANGLRCNSSPCANGEASIASYRANCGPRPCSFTYLPGSDTFRAPQDGVKMSIEQGAASAAGQLRIPIPNGGFNHQSAFVVLDFWEAAEWMQLIEGIGHRIYNHKETPIYFFWGSQSAAFGTWQGFQEARQSLQTQPAGGPYTSMIWAHSTGSQPRPPLSWRDGSNNGFPRVRLPYNVSSQTQRSYTEAIASASSFGPTVWTNPMQNDQTSVGGTAAGVGQEFGVIPDRWHRIFFYFERHPEEDYVCEVTTDCVGWTKAAYDAYMWVADTVRGPVQILNGVKIGFTISQNGGTSTSSINEIRIVNGCGAQCDSNTLSVQRDPLVKYYRNLIVLRGLTLADAQALLVKPVP